MAAGGRKRHGNTDKFLAAGTGVARGLNTQMPASDAADAAALTAASPPVDEGDSFFDDFEGYNHPFVLAGQNVVQFSSKVLEKKVATHEAVRAKKGPSVLESGKVTASQGLDLAQEMINDSTREATGGVDVEDVSRYQVTLHRWFADDAPDWTGEVIGPPNVYSLKTVDALLAGQTLIVFDKHNKKMWEGKVTYASHSLEDRPVFLENGDALYVADPGGMTRFDLATGNVRWRMDSVGIADLHADARGNVYVSTTDASADHISHPHEFNVHDKIHPLLLKVDAATGKVLWSQVSVGDKCFFSGKFLYATLIATLQSPLKLETGPDVHFNLRLLDPSNGRQIWEYQKINDPLVKTQVQNNWILLQFEDGVTVMKFFSL
jgi:outer membrane protein assembly factor BamB